MISTKGRYAVRVLVDFAEQDEGSIVPLRGIAERQGISQKYLQHIAKQLVDAGIIVGASGKGGGYRLTKDVRELTVLEVLEATEGSLAPVACLARGAEPCERAPQCKTLPLWKRYNDIMREYFGSVTIAELTNGAVAQFDAAAEGVGRPCVDQ